MPQLFANLPLACDGCFKGLPAVISLVLAVLLLIGSIYMLLASNYGARQAYLITMSSLGAFMIAMSLLWLVGGPGTTTGTGPRGREPAWIPFEPDSEFAADFADVIDDFPNDPWNSPQPGEIYLGKIEPLGEIQTASTAVKKALANKELVKDADEPYTKAELDAEIKKWAFRREGAPVLTDAEKDLPVATIRFHQHSKGLLMGMTIPATADHREATIFAYRDRGLVFLYALYFLVVSILLFALHLWLLGRYELHQKRMEAELEPDREPALV